MLEPPDIAVDTIIERVRAAYGLAASAAEFLPIGNDNDAWVYWVTAGIDVWFLKLRAGAVNEVSLTVPRFLASRDIPHVVAPIPTSSGALFDTGDPFAFILYPFIEGKVGADIGMPARLRTEVGAVLRRIHDLPAVGHDIAGMRREEFVPIHAAAVRATGVAIEQRTFEDPFERELAALWRTHCAEIEAIVDRTEVLGSLARERDPELVICHADIHAWNILVEPSGDFVIADWDETLLAPRERDLMFVEGGVGGLDNDASSFYAGYGEVEIDPSSWPTSDTSGWSRSSARTRSLVS